MMYIRCHQIPFPSLEGCDYCTWRLPKSSYLICTDLIVSHNFIFISYFSTTNDSSVYERDSHHHLLWWEAECKQYFILQAERLFLQIESVCSIEILTPHLLRVANFLKVKNSRKWREGKNRLFSRLFGWNQKLLEK